MEFHGIFAPLFFWRVCLLHRRTKAASPASVHCPDEPLRVADRAPSFGGVDRHTGFVCGGANSSSSSIGEQYKSAGRGVSQFGVNQRSTKDQPKIESKFRLTAVESWAVRGGGRGKKWSIRAAALFGKCERV